MTNSDDLTESESMSPNPPSNVLVSEFQVRSLRVSVLLHNNCQSQLRVVIRVTSEQQGRGEPHIHVVVEDSSTVPAEWRGEQLQRKIRSIVNDHFWIGREPEL